MSAPPVGPRRKRRYDNDATRLVGAGVDATEPRPHMVCLGCGKRQVTELPMLAVVFAAMAKAWAKAHNHCKERVAC